MNSGKRPQRRARDRRLRPDRRPWLLAPVALIALAIIGVAVLKAAERFPLGTLIFGTIFALSAVAVVLYIGELVVLGWLVDVLDWIASSGILRQVRPAGIRPGGRGLDREAGRPYRQRRALPGGPAAVRSLRRRALLRFHPRFLRCRPARAASAE